MDRRAFVKIVGAGAVSALVPRLAAAETPVLYVPCPPDPPGDTRSPDRLLEALSGDARDRFYGPELSTDFLRFPETLEEAEQLRDWWEHR